MKQRRLVNLQEGVIGIWKKELEKQRKKAVEAAKFDEKYILIQELKAQYPMLPNTMWEQGEYHVKNEYLDGLGTYEVITSIEHDILRGELTLLDEQYKLDVLSLEELASMLRPFSLKYNVEDENTEKP